MLDVEKKKKMCRKERISPVNLFAFPFFGTSAFPHRSFEPSGQSFLATLPFRRKGKEAVSLVKICGRKGKDDVSNPKNQAERAPILLSRAWSGLDTSFHEVVVSFPALLSFHRTPPFISRERKGVRERKGERWGKDKRGH